MTTAGTPWAGLKMEIDVQALVSSETDVGKLQRLVLSLSDKFGASEMVRSALAQVEKPMKSKALKKSKKECKEFDMSRYRQHHVAMEFQYDGGPYFGFASQGPGECEETIEKHIFEALVKCRLIVSRQDCGYSRCGRTDRGVSALGQVVALNVRSALPKIVSPGDAPKHICDRFFFAEKFPGNTGSTDRPAEENPVLPKPLPLAELDYPTLLNRCLPEGIRCTGWAAVTPEFSARFSCGYRTYRYFFVRKKLDVEAMSKAAALLVGDHDFRNMCKMDMANITNFKRVVYSAEISMFSDGVDSNSELYQVWMLEIRGMAFLWHMVRCIMAVLLLVGERKEQPEVVSALLDVSSLPGKPHYNMAAEEPLVLHQCGFDRLTIQRSPRVLYDLTQHFEMLWEKATIAASRARNALQFIATCSVREEDVECFGQEKSRRGGGTTGQYRSGGEMLSVGDISAGGGGGVSSDTTCDIETNSRKRTRLDDDDFSESSAATATAASSRARPSFAEALRFLYDRFGVEYPFPNVAHCESNRLVGGSYVKLEQRKQAEKYEEKRENLGGGRKDRLERHLQMNQEEKDPEFFSRMRSQGNI